MNHQQLKDRQRAEREEWPENLGLRVHRALSWLHRAEQLEAQEDPDGQFVLLWIAFNAAYATDIDEKYREREQQTFRGFLEKLSQLDVTQKRFEQLVWQELPKSIRVLLDNQFVFGGERGGRRRLTECQAARANAGTLTSRLVRREAGVSCMQRTPRQGGRGRYTSEAGMRSDGAQRAAGSVRTAR